MQLHKPSIAATTKTSSCCVLPACRSHLLRQRPFHTVTRFQIYHAAGNDTSTTQKIDNLSTDYCNDFECTSSPAVEQTVRSLAQDLIRGKYSKRLLQPDVQYQDGFRSFQGSDKFLRTTWAEESITNRSVIIKRMQMLDKGTAQIEWQLSGSLGMVPVQLPLSTTITMNLLTGRITGLKEDLDLSKCSPAAAVAVRASKVAWAAKQSSMDAGEGLNKAVDTLSSLTSMEEDDQIYNNPTDPTKFFQQQNNQQQDLLSLATVVALLYFAYRAFAELEKLN